MMYFLGNLSSTPTPPPSLAFLPSTGWSVSFSVYKTLPEMTLDFTPVFSELENSLSTLLSVCISRLIGESPSVNDLRC